MDQHAAATQQDKHHPHVCGVEYRVHPPCVRNLLLNAPSGYHMRALAGAGTVDVLTQMMQTTYNGVRGRVDREDVCI